MHSYRLIFNEKPPSLVSFEADDAAEAFRHALSHDCSAELWADDQRICRLDRTGSHGEIWVITGAKCLAGAEPHQEHDIAADAG